MVRERKVHLEGTHSDKDVSLRDGDSIWGFTPIKITPGKSFLFLLYFSFLTWGGVSDPRPGKRPSRRSYFPEGARRTDGTNLRHDPTTLEDYFGTRVYHVVSLSRDLFLGETESPTVRETDSESSGVDRVDG